MWLDTLNAMKKKSGKTSEQISEESGIPKGTLNKIFAGQTADPKYSTLSSLVHCLGYTVDDLDTSVDELELIRKKAPVTAAAETGEVDADQIKDLLVELGIMPDNIDLTEHDLRFLTVTFKAIADWFAQRSKDL